MISSCTIKTNLVLSMWDCIHKPIDKINQVKLLETGVSEYWWRHNEKHPAGHLLSDQSTLVDHEKRSDHRGHDIPHGDGRWQHMVECSCILGMWGNLVIFIRSSMVHMIFPIHPRSGMPMVCQQMVHLHGLPWPYLVMASHTHHRLLHHTYPWPKYMSFFL